jgi:curved DNA-binding protein CbpA
VLRNTGDNADMKNLVNSIAKSRELYKELSRQCHPDRFVNTDLQPTAEDIFQEISRNKRNYKILLALKERAIEKLNIKC